MMYRHLNVSPRRSNHYPISVNDRVSDWGGADINQQQTAAKVTTMELKICFLFSFVFIFPVSTFLCRTEHTYVLVEYSLPYRVVVYYLSLFIFILFLYYSLLEIFCLKIVSMIYAKKSLTFLYTQRTNWNSCLFLCLRLWLLQFYFYFFFVSSTVLNFF